MIILSGLETLHNKNNKNTMENFCRNFQKRIEVLYSYSFVKLTKVLYF